MKTIVMERDFTYRAKPNMHIVYLDGHTYRRVPEMAVRQIVAAGAGTVVENEDDIY